MCTYPSQCVIGIAHRREATPMSNHFICAGITKTGIGCTKRVAMDGGYCHIHAAYQDVVTLAPIVLCSHEGCSGGYAVEAGTAMCFKCRTYAENHTEDTAPVNLSEEESPMDVQITTLVPENAPQADEPAHPSYVDSTHVLPHATPRRDDAIHTYKPNDRDQDIAYFNKVLSKKSDIKRLIMPEYFTLPDWWQATAKLKAGESDSERTIRDWESWRKSYARAFRAGKVTKIDGVFFYAAKITPSVYLALIRAGKKSYTYQYSKDFGLDESSFVGQVGMADKYPLVHDVLIAANEAHAMKRRKASTQAEIDTAYEAYGVAFTLACNALRAIDTAPIVAPEVVHVVIDGNPVEYTSQALADATASAMA